jgi:hypothetical protein
LVIELKESSLVVMNSLNDEPYLRRPEGLAIATNAATALAKCRLELQRYMASPIHQVKECRHQKQADIANSSTRVKCPRLYDPKGLKEPNRLGISSRRKRIDCHAKGNVGKDT